MQFAIDLDEETDFWSSFSRCLRQSSQASAALQREQLLQANLKKKKVFGEQKHNLFEPKI